MSWLKEESVKAEPQQADVAFSGLEQARKAVEDQRGLRHLLKHPENLLQELGIEITRNNSMIASATTTFKKGELVKVIPLGRTGIVQSHQNHIVYVDVEGQPYKVECVDVERYNG